MRKSSTGRRSSSNPVRVSTLEREDKNTGRSDAKRPQKMKVPTQVDSSHIPRPKMRSSSSDRASIRRSNLKPLGKTPLRQQHLTGQPVRISNVATPLHTCGKVSTSRHIDLPSGSRHRSPSAERASGFGAKGPRKDNRPLMDKAYQNSMLNKIDQYFYEIQQNSLLNASNGSLKPITLNIFVDATNCLVKLLDIKQDLTIANYTDEMPKIAKKLHYPGVVTKSWLKTANTMHSWPQVLGWLSWLVGICDVKDKAELAFVIDGIPFVDNNGEEELERRSFLATLDMYGAWNAEKLDEEAALVEKLVDDMNEQHGDIDKAIQEEKFLLDEEERSIEAENRQELELDDDNNKLNKILENLKHVVSREIDEINCTEEYIKRVIVETQHLNVECITLENQIDKDIVQQNKMITIVENQKMSVEKRDEIIKQCSEIQNDIRQLDSHIKDMENELYALDLKFANSNQNLFKAVLAYNKDIVVHLDCDTGADLEALKMPETNMLSPDFMDTLKSKETALLNFKEIIKKQYDETKSAIETNSNEVDALQDKLSSLREKNKDFVAKAHEQRINIQQIQRQAKDTENKLKEQIKDLVNDIADLEQSMPDVETAANQLAEAQDKLEAVVRRADFIEQRMERFFNIFYQEIRNHRNELKIILEKLPKE